MIKKYLKNPITILALFSVLFLPTLTLNVYAATTGGPLQATLENPIGSCDMSLQDLVVKLLAVVAELGAVVCIFFIIYSGFLFIKAQGNEGELTKAKSIFMWSVIGTAVLLGASVIAELIQGTIMSVINNN